MRRWMAAVVVAAVWGAAGAVAAEPPVVASVVVQGAPRMELEQSVLDLLELRVGQPLDRRAVRRGIQTLVAGGEVSWLSLATEATPEGLVVMVDVDVRPTLTALRIETQSLLWRLRVSRWLGVEIGDPVDPERLAAAASRARRRLVDRGYPEAVVEPYLQFDLDGNTARAEVQVDTGPALTVGRVEVAGLPQEVSEQEIAPSVRVGRRISRQYVDRQRTRIEEAMRRRGWWEARVVSTEVVGGPSEATLKIGLEPGTRYRLEVDGGPQMKKVVERAMPDPVDEDVHPTQVDALAEQLNEGLRRQGWPRAGVSVSLGPQEGGARPVRVAGDLGERVRVEAVEFPGARQVEARDLRRVVRVRPGAGGARRPLTAESLAEDRRRLEAFYRQRGFVDAVVHEAALEDRGPSGLVVAFAVDEGLRWTVEQFRIEGLPTEASFALDDDSLQMEVTDPWDPERLESLRQSWVRVMRDVGYPEAEAVAEIEMDDPGRVRVTLVADPDAFVTLGEVAVAGLTGTREAVVRRVLDHVGLVEGRPYSQDTIVRAQQKLYELGLFRRVAMVPVPGDERRSRRGLVVQLEEGLQRSYVLGLGWDTEERFRFTLGWSHLNLFGGAHAVSVETRQSSREVRFQLSVREALLPVIHTPGYLAVYQTEETFAEYDQRRRGLWTEIGDRRQAPFRQWIRYEYQIVRPEAPEEILSDLERQDQEIELSSITPVLEWDTRDDLLNPSRGLFATLAPEYAFPAFTAESHYVKAQVRATQYIPMPFGKAAAGVRLAGTWNLDEVDGVPPNLQVPLASRLFAGGRSTHRAFPTDRLGIPGQTLDDDGTPIGGNALVLVNLDVQRRIWNELAAVVFLDGGNVWASPEDVRFEDFRWGAGLGLRYDTPAGPFRVEYGHKLDRQEGESGGEWYFSFGVAF